ncbi:type I-U CRISPR-associated protein Cas5/Cas6 [Myxococcota bacterium]|nr:type I-U CRISPR-associated protein Cas5/Cas6 [Myxococcota bacterium]MBU1379570.1 type I-U CRISPR-associated protein Cas5/Cas6 [Myxococcota bacterium]MBU1495797.1 type I-U CRISPR-associated protein Cas5/Cas6 [Myxococcota bacterium]
MITIEIEFLNGRYHANPWGRNVNEGVPEWPVSPFRLARAVYAVSKRYFPEVNDNKLENLLLMFTSECSYVYDPVGSKHIRLFLSQNSYDIQDKKKVFDAFITMKQGTKLQMVFESGPDEEDLNLLEQMLSKINYLGRSESWVSISLNRDFTPDEITAFPANIPVPNIPDNYEKIEMAFPLTKSDYLRIVQPNLGKKLTNLSWLGVLAMATDEVQANSLSSHPCIRYVTYYRPRPGEKIPPERAAIVASDVYQVKYALVSTALPPITDAVKIAETVRKKLMGSSKAMGGGELSAVSTRFSGKNAEGEPLENHIHAFILPVDEDRDGYIDHIYVKSEAPFEPVELEAMDHLSSIWSTKGRPSIDMIPVRIFRESEKSENLKGQIFISHTPFVTARHWRKGRGDYQEWVESELIKELQNHNLPMPEKIEKLDKYPGSHEYDWWKFTRKRQKDAKPLSAYGFRITFKTPLEGPFAVGPLSHFGLGTFVMENGC